MSVVTQLYFKLLKKTTTCPFSGWGIIRLRLEYRRKLIYYNVDIKHGEWDLVLQCLGRSVAIYTRCGLCDVYDFICRVVCKFTCRYENLKRKLYHCNANIFFNRLFKELALNHTMGMMPPKNKVNIHEALCKFITRCILPTMKNVSDKTCRDSQNTHFMFSNFFQKPCHLWDNVENCGTGRWATYWQCNVAQKRCDLHAN
jgi:hypothetical protein